jgi:hypothetical protein
MTLNTPKTNYNCDEIYNPEDHTLSISFLVVGFSHDNTDHHSLAWGQVA